MSRKLFLFSSAIIAAIVWITYAPATRLNFYGDDYAFLEIAGRSSLTQYLAFYFDPRLQTGWYRPMQGMFFGIEWVLFGKDPIGYHVVNVLVHFANCLLLFALVWCVLKKWRVAIIATLIYAGLPLYGVAVFWPGDADFLLTFFYLLSLFFWILHLQANKFTSHVSCLTSRVSRFTFHATRNTQHVSRFTPSTSLRAWFYILSFLSFLLALLTKEFGVTLPIVLFLVDRLVLQTKTNVADLARRYAAFLVVWLFYLPLEYYIQSRSVLTNLYGYGIGAHTLSNAMQYLAWLAFPWGLPEPVNYIWLVVAMMSFVAIIIVKRSMPLIFLGVAAVLAFLPVINFPWFFTRYLYLSVMASAVVVALLFDWVWMKLGDHKWFAPIAFGVVALFVYGNSLSVASAAADFAELGRQTRVPFRDIAQQHPSFPDDTYLYFIDPPTITSQLSGMFFLRYGAGIRVSSNQVGEQRANLRGHKNAYVIYFDDQQRTRELPVDMALSVETRLPLPLDFAEPIRLEGYELVSAKVKRGQPILLLLYWRGLRRIDKDLIVFAHLVDQSGGVVAAYEQAPRHGTAPTRTWQPGEMLVDAIQLPIPTQVSPGKYRLAVGLYDSTTRRRVGIGDTDHLVIEPLSVVE